MKTILYLLFLALLLSSCGKRSGITFKESNGNRTNDIELQAEVEKITFRDLQERIIIPHCITCHESSGTEEGIARWITDGDPENSKLFNVVKNGSMPKKADPLSLSEVEFVRQYIVDTKKIIVKKLETVDFQTLKNEILVPHCLSCHHRMDNEENLQRWINKENPMESRLLRTVTEGKMPKNAESLSLSAQSIIIKYLNNYIAQENK